MSSDGLPFSPFTRRAGIGLERGAKSLLRNVIRHTDTHNRMLEEAEMWQIHKRMRGEDSSSENEDRRDEKKDRGFREPKIENSFLYDDRRAVEPSSRSGRGMHRKAHMDEEGRGSALINGDHLDQASSTYWQRQLLKAEENDDDRWGHGGFKELYPHDFDSDRSDRERKKEEAKKVKKKMKREERKKSKKFGKKKKDKTVKHKKKRKKKLSRVSDSEDSSCGDERKKKKKTSSEKFSDGDTDSGVESRQKWKRSEGKKDGWSVEQSRKGLSSGRKRNWEQRRPPKRKREEQELSRRALESRAFGHSRDHGDMQHLPSRDHSSSTHGSIDRERTLHRKRNKRENSVAKPRKREELSETSDSDSQPESSHRKRDRRKW